MQQPTAGISLSISGTAFSAELPSAESIKIPCPSSPQLKSIKIPCPRIIEVMAGLHHHPGKITKLELPYGNIEHNCKIKTHMALHLQRNLRLYFCTGRFKIGNFQLAFSGEKTHNGLKAQFWLETVIRIFSRE